jgi:uncharacterized cupin superfamily protein
MGPVHWDDAAGRRIDAGVVSGTVHDLGGAAGSVEIGVRRWRPDPGCQTTAAHTECSEEEITYVLAGSGWSWQDGAVCEVRAGDCLVHLIGGPAHTLVAGDGGLDVLAFGERIYAGTVLPRAGVVRLGTAWVELSGPPHPFVREDAAGRVDVADVGERPPNVVAVEDVPAHEDRPGKADTQLRDLGRAAGSVRTGLRHVTIDPGAEGIEPHCHSAEEELFVVLDGSGTLVLGDEDHVVGRGSVVARPAGTRVAHHFVAGDDGLVLLAYGQRDPRDVCWYPRTSTVFVRGIGVRFRVDEPLAP